MCDFGSNTSVSGTTATKSNNKSKSTATTNSVLPKWQTDVGKGTVQYAIENTPDAFTPYEGDRVAELGDGYGTAKSILDDLYADGGSALAEGRSVLDSLRTSANNDVTKTATDHMSPYIDAVLNPQLRQIEELRGATRLRDNAEATMAGAFGDPQAGIARSLTGAKFDQLATDTTGKAHADAYDKGLAQANTVMARMAAMPGMYTAQENAEFNRAGAIGKAYTDFAKTDQAEEQKHLDVGYDEYLKALAYAPDRAKMIMDLLTRAPVNKGATTSTNSRSSGSGTGTETKPDNTFLEMVSKLGGSLIGSWF